MRVFIGKDNLLPGLTLSLMYRAARSRRSLIRLPRNRNRVHPASDCTTKATTNSNTKSFVALTLRQVNIRSVVKVTLAKIYTTDIVYLLYA